MKVAGLRLIRYLWRQASHAFDGLTTQLSDHRVILNWMYALAYLALIFFCVTSNKDSMTAAIYATAGIVGTIFSAWVVGSAIQTTKITPYTPPYSGQPPAQPMSDQDAEAASGD